LSLYLRAIVSCAALLLASASAWAADIDCGSATLLKSTRLKVEACIDPTIWDSARSGAGEEFLYYTKDGKAGFALVTEEPAVPLGEYHDAILDLASKQSGALQTAKSHDDTSLTINGKDWRRMEYSLELTGQSLEYLNYYYSEGGLGSAQFIFWSLPADAGMVRTELAGKVMATVTITP
jgi:hypothetical protein